MAAQVLFLSVLCLIFIVISSEQSPPADAVNQLFPGAQYVLTDANNAPNSIPGNSSKSINSESERLIYQDTFASEAHQNAILEWLDHDLAGEPPSIPTVIRKSYGTPTNRPGALPKKQHARKPRASGQPRSGKESRRKPHRRRSHKGKARPRRARAKQRAKKARKSRRRGKAGLKKARGKSRRRSPGRSRKPRRLHLRNDRSGKSKGIKGRPRRPCKGKPRWRRRRGGRSRGRHLRNQRFRPRWFIPWRWHPHPAQRRHWRRNRNPHRRRWNRFRSRHPHRRGPVIVPLPLPKKTPKPPSPKKTTSFPTVGPTLPPNLRGAPRPTHGASSQKGDSFTVSTAGEGHAFAHAKSKGEPVVASASSKGSHEKQTPGKKASPIPQTTGRPIASSPSGPTLPPGMRGAPISPPSRGRNGHLRDSYTIASEGGGHAFAGAKSHGKPVATSMSSNEHRMRGKSRLPWFWRQQRDATSRTRHERQRDFSESDEDSIIVTGQSISLSDSQPLQSLLYRRESNPFLIKRPRRKRSPSSSRSNQRPVPVNGKSRVNDSDASREETSNHGHPENESSFPFQVRIPSPRELLSKAKKSLCKKIRRPCGQVCKRVSQLPKNCERTIVTPKVCKRVKHTTVPCGGKHVRMCKVKRRIPRVCKRRVVIKKKCPRFKYVQLCVPFKPNFCHRNPYCRNLARRPCKREPKTSACPTPPLKPCNECKKRIILKKCSRVIKRKIRVACPHSPINPRKPSSQPRPPPALPQLPAPPRIDSPGVTPNTQFVPSEAAGLGSGSLPPRSPPGIQFVPRPPPRSGSTPPRPPRSRPPGPHFRPPRPPRPPRPSRHVPPRNRPPRSGGSASSQFAPAPRPRPPRQRPTRAPRGTQGKPSSPSTSAKRPPPLPSNPIFHKPSTVFVATSKPTPCPCASSTPPVQKSTAYQARRAAFSSPAPSKASSLTPNKSPSPTPSSSPVTLSFHSYANASASDAGVDSRYEDPSIAYGAATSTLMADAVTFKDTGSFASSVRCFASFFEDAYCRGAPVQCHLFHERFDAEVCTANVCRECKKIRHMATSRKLKQYCGKFVKTSCININLSTRVSDRQKFTDILDSLQLPQVGHSGSKQCFKTVQKVVQLPCNRAMPRNERCVKGCRMKICRNRRKPVKKQFCRNNLPKRCRDFFDKCRPERQTKKCRRVRKKVGTRPCNTTKVQKYRCFRSHVEQKPCRHQRANVKRCARSVTQKFICGKLKKKVKVACRKPRIIRKCHRKFCNIKKCRKV